MKRIRFDIDYWLKHHPMLETKCGYKARILATDMLGYFPICYAYIHQFKDGSTNKDVESTFACNRHGYSLCEGIDFDYDLYMLIH